MQQPLKSVLSVAVIAFFLLFAYASSWDDVMATSTNTTVAIKDCAHEPVSLSGQMTATLSFNHKNGISISGATGEIYITHQIANEDCTPNVLQSIVASFVTDLDGDYEYIGPTFLHNNSQDLFRVEVHIDSRSGLWDDWKSVQVKYYGEATFVFNAIAPDAL